MTHDYPKLRDYLADLDRRERAAVASAPPPALADSVPMPLYAQSLDRASDLARQLALARRQAARWRWLAMFCATLAAGTAGIALGLWWCGL